MHQVVISNKTASASFYKPLKVLKNAEIRVTGQCWVSPMFFISDENYDLFLRDLKKFRHHSYDQFMGPFLNFFENIFPYRFI